MKSCPQCSRTYSDETLNFCLNDGSLLSAPYDPQANRTVPTSGRDDPPPTEVLPSAIVRSTRQSPQYQTSPAFQSPTFIPGAGERLSQKNGIKKGWLAAGILVFLVLIAGFIAIVGRSLWLSRENSTIRQPTFNTDTSSGNSTPTPTASTPPAKAALDITGTWKGKFQDTPATLIINNQNDNSFSGTLNNSGALVVVGGTINANTRQMTLEERQVLKTQEGHTWILGSGKGSISEDGKRMRGKSRDKRNGPYSWDFSKR